MMKYDARWGVLERWSIVASAGTGAQSEGAMGGGTGMAVGDLDAFGWLLVMNRWPHDSALSERDNRSCTSGAREQGARERQRSWNRSERTTRCTDGLNMDWQLRWFG